MTRYVWTVTLLAERVARVMRESTASSYGPVEVHVVGTSAGDVFQRLAEIARAWAKRENVVLQNWECVAIRRGLEVTEP